MRYAWLPRRRTGTAVLFSSLLLLSLLVILGCTDASRQILAEDFMKMDNDQLLRYFYRIEDEIDRIERQSAASQVGFGVGAFGRGGGVGIGTMTGTYGESPSEELRKRRIDVRMELKKRGLNP